MSEIEVRHLTKTFEQKGIVVEALKDINLNIESGDIYGIIGMSGAGKSTLVRCLNYLEKPTDGQVIVAGQDLGALSEKELRKQRSDIAMIFQHFNLLMQKSVLDNICFPLLIQKVDKQTAKERARELLKIVGLAEKEKAYFRMVFALFGAGACGILKKRRWCKWERNWIMTSFTGPACRWRRRWSARYWCTGWRMEQFFAYVFPKRKPTAAWRIQPVMPIKAAPNGRRCSTPKRELSMSICATAFIGF